MACCRTVERLRENLEVNVIGVHAMIQAFLPLLQSGHSKTIVNISSGSGSLSGCYEEVLSQTKQVIKFIKEHAIPSLAHVFGNSSSICHQTLYALSLL